MNHTTRTGLFLSLPLVLGSVLATPSCSTPARPTPAPRVDRPEDQDRHVARLEGVFAGNDNRTPFGAIPFALSFERQPDGSLHARTDNGKDFYVDLRLAKDPSGRWLFTEEAALPGRGKQRHTLAAASLSEDLLVFRDVEEPDDLEIRIQFPPAAMHFQVMLAGKEHVLLNLPRLEGAAAQSVRQRLATRRAR